MFDIKMKGEEPTIYFYGAIGDEWDGITDIGFAKELNAIGNVKNMTLRINSDGGNVFQGMAIYNLLKDHPAYKVAKIDGLAASIASVIPLSANEVIMGEGSTYMIHNPWIITAGQADDLREVADILDLERDNIADIYARKTKMDVKDIRKLMKDETWMRGQQALEMGFVDQTGEGMKIAAKVHEGMAYKNIPEYIDIQDGKPKHLTASQVFDAAERAGLNWRDQCQGKKRYLAMQQRRAVMDAKLRKLKI